MWITGFCRSDNNVESDPNYSKMFISSYNENNGRGYVEVSPYAGINGGFFYEGHDFSDMATFVNQGLEAATSSWANGWSYPSGSVRGLAMRQYSELLMVALPSSLNEAEVLMPAMTSLRRSDGVVTPVVSMRHGRKLRIDNVQPGEIVTYGADQWKCYPLYAKNTAQRDGVSWPTGANHSGTFGVAIRMPEA